ncbi:MAG: HlyC/CorC family transporter [Corynebacteriales bacterium]|nr:HlyC/CorC family transporter [Mycobacteriales bacterium]
MSIAIGVLLIVLLTVATGYFVAQEFAYVAADRGKLQQIAETGDSAAARALRVCERLSFTLSGAQLGITVTALLVGYVAEPFIGAGVADALGFTGLGLGARMSISVLFALIFATVVQMVFGELAPKNWAIAHPEKLARALSRSTLMYLTIAGPVIKVFDAAANRLLHRFGIEPVEELPQGATPEDLQRIVADSTAQGGLDLDVSGLLRRGLGFRVLSAEQAMTPRVHVQSIEPNARVSSAIELMDTGYSRFPVIGPDGDEILGIVGAKEIMSVPAHKRAHTAIRMVSSRALVVPSTLPLPKVLELLRREHRQLACVADEYGGFAGVISLEDIAEELVGEIHDEDDPTQPTTAKIAEGSWTLPARLRIDEVHEATGVVLPTHEDYETVSGLILLRLGRMPVVGDHIVIQPEPAEVEEPETPAPTIALKVLSINRHVPATVAMWIISAGSDE